MRLLKTLSLLASFAASSLAFGAQSSLVFPHGALTDHQRSAWHSYVSAEAAVFGCEYGDDPRLLDNPVELLRSISADEQSDPVRLTMRTWVSLGPNTREILGRQSWIASVECNPVYVDVTTSSGRQLFHSRRR